MQIKKLLAILVAAIPAGLFAQGAPIGGSANVRLTSTAVAAIPGSQVVVNVNADLTGVTGTCNGAVPAVLGGYTIPVNFDQTQLQFVSSSACTSPQFATAPATTAAATANTTGQVTISTSQTNQTAPTGNVCVAQLTFNVIAGAGTTLTPATSGTLSSAVQTCSGGPAGPAAIPFVVAGLNLNPAASVPAMSPIALVAMAAAIAAVALFSFRK